MPILRAFLLLFLAAHSLSAAAGPFDRVDLPDAWESRFWSDPAVVGLVRLEPRKIADLVPNQAGIYFCRCPVCDSTESATDWAWSPVEPTVMICVKCRTKLPNDTFPAQIDKKVPEDLVEVLTGVIHHYPYHLMASEHEKYPEERLYLAAKRDDLARQFLAKFTLYAAVRNQEHPDPVLALQAAIVLVKFAQVYPTYATHFDQPGQPKYFDRADLKPPYRASYATAKWTWTASQNVPMNLVIAYALLRQSDAIDRAGLLLDVSKPRYLVEHNLFSSSAEFVLAQPEADGEASLAAFRGVLAVGRLLEDPTLTTQAVAGIEKISQASFAFDGLWRSGDGLEHRRVVAELDGWIGRLMVGLGEPPILSLARFAGSSSKNRLEGETVRQVSWPAVESRPISERRPRLLGASGLAQLIVGSGPESLEIELRAPGNLGSPHPTRLALRLAVGGRTVLGDLDEEDPTRTGFERATVSHNTVVVDGLNQRESPTKAAVLTRGGDPLFFAADPDFQVARYDDPRAYPTSATRYRQTIVARKSGASPYAISIFEVRGGLRHDLLLHGAGTAIWSTPTIPLHPIATLLPPGISFLSSASREDGRWFIQSFGEFQSIVGGRLQRPAIATLITGEQINLRAHLLGDLPEHVILASTPSGPDEGTRRSTLISRRQSTDGSALKTVFVTLFEPGGQKPLKRVGRVASSADQVVIYVETTTGSEHVVISLEPGGTQTVELSDGKSLHVNGVAACISREEMIFAGGSSASLNGVIHQLPSVHGSILESHRELIEGSRGWFETDLKLDSADGLTGRVVRIKHGDGTIRGWTIVRATTSTNAHTRLFVHEEPGFGIDPKTRVARDYQFPGDEHPGPHLFTIDQIHRRSTKNLD